MLTNLTFAFTIEKPTYRNVYNWNELNQFLIYLVRYIDNFGIYTINITTTPDSTYVSKIDHTLIKNRGAVTHSLLDDFYNNRGIYQTTEVDPVWEDEKSDYLTTEVDPVWSSDQVYYLTTYVSSSTNGYVDSTSWVKIPTISFGNGVPISTPGKIGDIYVDTSGAKHYSASGVADSTSWDLLN